jgi:hypothetical protein
VTPIFVRPVREQLEHDRLIRFLQARYKRKFDVTANVGDQQLGAVKLGVNIFYPDLVLMTGKKLAGLIEVETVESTNNLEAMAQWTHFSRARVPFHLYVPVLAVDAARRLCDANQVSVSEIWTYRAVNDQFDLVRVFQDPNAIKAGNKVAPKVILRMPDPKPEPKPEPPPPPPAPVPVAKPIAAKPVIPAKPVVAAKPVVPAKPAPVAAKAGKPVIVKPAPAAPPVKSIKAKAPLKSKPAKPAKPAKKAPAKAKPSAKTSSKPKAKASAKKRK